MDRATVTFESQGAVVSVATGTTVAEAAHAAGVRVEVPCGGVGLCGGCRVVVEGAVSAPSRDETGTLSAEEIGRGVRLACRARVLGAVVVRPVPARPADAVRAVTLSTAEGFPVAPPAMHGAAADGRALGAAVDLGTTTIAASLIDLRNGDVLATASADNPQAALGHDVLSRVSAALGGKAEALREAAVLAVESSVMKLLGDGGVAASGLREVVVAGNTAMASLLLGADVTPLAAAPWEGAFIAPVRRTAVGMGMDALGDVEVYVMPGASAFIGSDVVGGAVVTRLAGSPIGTMLIDLGTNGEIVLRTPDGLLAASAAAGPAFEGGAIENGMRAEPGAVERARYADGRLELETVADGPPRGICGSGLLDLTAALLDAGVVDAEGRMRATGPLGGRVSERDGQVAFEVAPGLVLTQRDVRALQLAKGAVRAALSLLLAEAGLGPANVPEVIVAGGFGYHAEERSLLRVGAIDSAWEGRVRSAGNTAMAGAVASLVSAEARETGERLAREVRTLDLATHPRFEEVFLGSLGFPEA